MKAIAFKIPSKKDHSVRVQVDEGSFFYDKLHYHPEFQITAIEKGEGILMVENSFCQFQPGDVFVLSGDVPHLFKCSKVYYGKKSPGVKAISLFFTMESLGSGFFEIPEMKSSLSFLAKARRGIRVTDIKKSIHLQAQISSCEQLQAAHLIARFIDVLADLSMLTHQFVCPANPHKFSDLSDQDRWRVVFNYIAKNASKNMSLQDVASVAQLSISQFSKAFKQRTRKSFVEFLNQLRIEEACTLLITSNRPIELIAKEVGFNNLSNFNRQFKNIKKSTPRSFRKNIKEFPTI